MSFNSYHKVGVHNIETTIFIGFHAHERGNPQRILVDAWVEGSFPLMPRTLEDCFNYETVYRLVREQWPALPHRVLLEECASDLLRHVFTADARVMCAWARISKPDVFPRASVFVETQWTREDFDTAQR